MALYMDHGMDLRSPDIVYGHVGPCPLSLYNHTMTADSHSLLHCLPDLDLAEL